MTTAPHTGPAGYEQQYRVTAWFALLFDAPSLRVFVEHQDEEDFTLRLDVAGVAHVVEVQVKSSTNPLTVRDFAEILAKFPKRATTNCFLERIRNKNDAIAVVVVGGRVLDGVAPFVMAPKRLSTTPRSKPPLKRGEAESLLASLGELYKGKTTNLGKARHAHCLTLSQNIDVAEINELARRIFVVERMDKDETVREIVKILETQYQVPGASAPIVADPLLRMQVELGRDKSSDIVPALRQTIETYRVGSVTPRQPYLTLGNEDVLANQLEQDRILLLTGFPWCGKTQLAVAIAESFQKKGYHVALFKMAEEAERFLRDPASGERRLALLNDPFGRTELESQATDAWDRLYSLIPLAQHRALLVTSRTDLLHSFHRDSDPESWRLAGFSWVKVSMCTGPVGENVWRVWANDRGLDTAIVDRVAGLLSADMNLQFGPGHFRHLATLDPALLRQASFDELVEKARSDAEAIGRELCKKTEVREVLRVLALTADTLSGPREAELHHLLGSTDEFPGELQRAEVRDTFPSYGKSGYLTESQRNVLGELEHRGAIEWSSHRLVFTHPFWERAAAVALIYAGSFARHDIHTVGRRVILCLDSDCAVRALEVLGRLRARPKVGESERDELAATMLAGIKSIFPRVSSQALISILTESELDTLPEEQQDLIMGALAASLPTFGSLKWEGGQAWIAGNNYRIESIFVDPPGLSTALRMVTHEGTFTPEAVFLVLSNQASEGSVSIGMLETALSSPEVVLRAKAGHVIAKNHITKPEGAALVLRALNDNQPWVVAETIVGLALSWSVLGSEVQAELKNRLAQILRRPAVALVTVSRLQFLRKLNGWDEKWFHGETTPWDLWASCTTAALTHYPARRHLGVDKLYNLSKDACERLSDEAGLALCEAWLNWAERRVEYMVLNDYGGSIAQVLLIATRNNASLRSGLFSRLLKQQDTGLQALILRDLSLGWQDLADTEKRAVLEVLSSGRTDERWLRAIIMVAGDPSPDVQMAITGCDHALRMEPDVVLQTWPARLLDDCVSVFVGHPHPLSWIGTHHTNLKFWTPVIARLARDPESISFPIAIREIVNHPTADIYSECWRELCQEPSVQCANEMFKNLLLATMRERGAELETYWEQLMRSPVASILRGKWAERVGEVIPGIDYHDNFALLSHISEAFDYAPAEDLLMQVLESYRADGAISREALVQRIIREFDESTILTAQSTWALDILARFAESMSETQRHALDARRERLIEIGSEQVYAIDENYSLADWIVVSERSMSGRS